MNRRYLIKSLGIFIPIVFIISTLNAAGYSYITEATHPYGTVGSEYKGHLRIYIVEIESRWDMENGAPYHYALLDFAFDNDISIRYLDTYTDTINWQGDVERDNVIVMAAVFNAEEHTNYADPPDKRPFKAHYVDAATAAKPGETASNTVNDQFTHTVFCEVGTASWCSACPKMANELKAVFDKGDYPFYFVELVVDKNSEANRRMDQYNLKYLPTAFYDGGKEVVVGGGHGTSYHENIIKECGKRDVHNLDLTLSVEWLREGNLGINISITNKEPLPNDPPETPTITGPAQGKVGEEQEYNIKTTDPDGDNVYYYIDWGDNTTSGWIGPYKSGEKVTVSHTWNEKGYYIIKVKAKDYPDEEESDWQWLKVTMSNSKSLFFYLRWIQSLKDGEGLLPLLKSFL